MEILPIDDRLVVEQVSPSEMLFVRTGMDAVVKIDAYDYTIFGDLSGTLAYLSADTLVDRPIRAPFPTAVHRSRPPGTVSPNRTTRGSRSCRG